MLKTYELEKVLLQIEQNGNPGMTMLRLKKDTGLYGTRLTNFLEQQTEFFTLTENGQMVNINTMQDHHGDREKILGLYEKQLANRRKKLIGAGVAIAVACGAALATVINSMQVA